VLCALPGSVAAERSILVSVAISLEPALSELAALFERSHQGTELLLNAGGSGVLSQQARRGAPVDLFVSASPVELDRLEAEGLLSPSERRIVASNRLVIVVPRGTTPPARVEELIDRRFDRIAVGNPATAPVGRYTRQALDALGLWDSLAPRLVQGENARQVLDYVSRGEASAGLLYRTDADLLPDRVELGPELPAGSHQPIRYEAAVLNDAEQARLAGEFLDLLVSETGLQVLRSHGFADPR